MKKYLILITIVGFLFVLYILISPYFKYGGLFDVNYTYDDMKENYYKNRRQITELQKYFLNIVPNNKSVLFEFNKRVDRFNFVIREKDNGHFNFISGYNMKLHSYEFNNLIKKIGWTNKHLDTLLLKLKKANCISIFKQEYDNKPITIGFRRVGYFLPGYSSYLLFNQNVPDSVINEWSNKEGCVKYNDSVIFKTNFPL